MIRIVTCDEMKRMESRTMEMPGIPSLSLMERAAYQSFLRIRDNLNPEDKTLVFCGSGNNGGDGFCIARILHENGFDVSVIFAGNPDKMTEQSKLNKDVLKRIGVPVIPISDSKKCNLLIKNADVIVDALMGIGFKGELRGDIKIAVSLINSKKKKVAFVYSIDIPSGLNGDTGVASADCVVADYTITMQFIKRGLLINDGPDYTGEVITENIGIFDDGSKPSLYTLGDEVLKLIPKRKKTGNKGTFGKVLFITGCEEMPGAAIMSAKAAFKTGCGMVKIISDKANRSLLMHEIPEAMFRGCDSKDVDIIKSFKWCTSLVIGCGLGKSERAKELLMLSLENCEKPLIIDADGINLMADIPSSKLKKILKERKKKGFVTVITPHPGEFARLFGTDIKYKMNQDPEFVKANATELGLIIVAKDARTIVSDGKSAYIQTVTGDKLATAGSGDVLAGIMGTMINLVKNPFDAAVCSVFIHGKTGVTLGKGSKNHGARALDIINAINTVY